MPTLTSGHNTHPGQVMGQLIRSPVQLPITDLSILIHNRNRLRRLCRLFFEQLMHALIGRVRRLRAVPLHQQLLTFWFAQDSKLADPGIHRNYNPFQQRSIVLQQPPHAFRIE